MNWDKTITTAPYNTLNLPQNESPNLNNPMLNNNKQYEINEKNNFYDPTIPLVENYLKTNMSMYDNRGKYFDSYLFNKKFDEYISKVNAERLLRQKVQLYDLDKIANIQIAPYQLPIKKILINIKNFWFNLFDSIVNGNPLNSFTLTSDNFFYLGISFVVIYILFVLLTYIFT